MPFEPLLDQYSTGDSRPLRQQAHADCFGQENRTNVVIFDSAEMDAKLLNAAIYFMYSGDCGFPHAMHFDL